MPSLSEQIVNVATIRMKRTSLDQADTLLAASLADELIDTLEHKLNRYLYPRTVTETYLVPSSGRIILNRGPVVSITSMSYVGGGAIPLPANPIAYFDSGDVWAPGARVTVTYVAGEIPGDMVIGNLADIVARTLLAGVKAASGVIRSYSVEGTTITYGDVADGGTGGSGRITVGSLRAFKRLRRRVMIL